MNTLRKSAAGSKGERCRKGERLPASRGSAFPSETERGEPFAGSPLAYAAFLAAGATLATAFGICFALTLVANSCFTLRAIASVSTLYA